MILPLEFRSKRKKNFKVKEVRKRIFESEDTNLKYLLNKRFGWMKKYIFNKKVKTVIELGSGNGCIKKIINNKKIILTDVIQYDWIDRKVDMSNINLGKNFFKKVDIFIINHALHHCPNPGKCLKGISKYLRKGGLILINEPETSFFLKLIQILVDDEGWSYKKNVFDSTKDVFSSKDPWFSNTAIANLLFYDEMKFKNHYPNYEILKNELSEFFVFLNSGGVNTDIPKLPLNLFFLNILNYIDTILIKLFPSLFALNRSVILRKKN